MKITIRPAQISDLNEILKVERSAFPKHLQAKKNTFLERLKLFPTGFLIAEHNGKIVAISTALIIDKSSSIKDLDYPPQQIFRSDGNTYYLRSLAVDKQFQKQGIGKKLINAHLQNARVQGLKTFVFTSAQEVEGYYLKLGFTKVGNYTPFAEGIKEVLWKKEL